MTATSAFGVTWLWLLLMGGAGSIPLGGAPLPLDPVLSNIAPEECLWYASYAGQGEADAASSNQTEQLFAEPQVRRFVEEIQSQLMKAARRAGGPEREKRVLMEQGPKLLRALFTRPSAVYVEDLKPGEGEAFDATAAFVLNAGEQQAEMQAAIAALLTLIPPDRPQLETEEVAGVEWRRLPTPPEAPVIRFGWKDAYFIIAVGGTTPDELLARMDGAAPAWLDEIRSEHPIERELSLGYLNVAGILERVRPYVEAENPKAWPAVETLGLTHIEAVHGVSGYDDVACKSVAHIVTDGERPGLLGMLPHEPLEPDDLKPIPKDALFAVAKCIDAGELWDHGVEVGRQLEPRAKEDAEKAMWELETKLGVNIRDDVLGSLDDAWTFHVPGGELMLSWLNTTAAVRVKDADTLGLAIEKLVDAAQAEMARKPHDGSISESKLGEHTMYTFQLPGPAPISPSWCVGDDWLVLSLSPAAVRTALEQQEEDSLAAADGVSEALAAEGGAAALMYQDTPQLVRSVYPWLQMGVQMAAGELRKNGVEIDPTILPSREAILKHLRPGILTLTHADDGFHFTSHHSLPGGGNLAAAAPVGAALILPAMGKAREAAQAAQSMNNMKQIVLAMVMYQDMHKEFPTDIYSEDGKPLLSWRVQLLPYMEQNALYEQLKLDESWDSEHNAPITSTVVELFNSPGSPPSANTRYLALKGPGTVFEGNEKLSFRQITDGSSNTIAFVEAAPDRGVPWAKPADLKFKPKKPRAGLPSPDGSFLTAFCDGHIEKILPVVDDEAVKAMATYAGEEAIALPGR